MKVVCLKIPGVCATKPLEEEDLDCMSSLRRMSSFLTSNTKLLEVKKNWICYSVKHKTFCMDSSTH